MPPTGTNDAFEAPYVLVTPRKHVVRVLHSGKPPNLNAPTFLRSPTVFSPYLRAVLFVTAMTSVSKNGVGRRSVRPLFASSSFASAYVAAPVFGVEDLWCTT